MKALLKPNWSFLQNCKPILWEPKIFPIPLFKAVVTGLFNQCTGSAPLGACHPTAEKEIQAGKD